MEINNEKRQKFMEYAGKRVNNILHDIQILEPMARSSSYDFTRQDIDEMFTAINDTLVSVKEEFEKKFEEKQRSEKKIFTFGASSNTQDMASSSVEVANQETSEITSNDEYNNTNM